MRSPVWLQILADVLETELIAPQAEEGAAYGAALLAMVSVGVYPNLTTALKMLPQEQSVVRPSANVVYKEAFQRYPLLMKLSKPSGDLQQQTAHKIVIIGGGFGGLYTAKALGNSKQFEVTLIDKRNFHLFQPLLYQVATGKLSPGDISSPLRAILSHHRHVKVLMDEVQDIDPEQRQVTLQSGTLPYDTLIVATGVSHHYFGNEQWATVAPGLKTVEDALEMRRRIFLAFEAAEKETDPERRRAWLTFVVVGGGPTGVELAGALADLAYEALKDDFRSIDTQETQILLLEGLDRVLPPYPADLSTKAAHSLEHLGVVVETQTLVTNITEDAVTVRQGEQTKEIPTKTVLWAAGVRASKMGTVLAERAGAELDRVGRVVVNPDLSLPGRPDIFIVGDLAHYAHQDDKPLPGVAPVAMQQGAYVAKLIQQRLQGEDLPPFHYSDAGSLAVIGHNAAVASIGGLKLSGFPAWLIWVFVHIYYLIEFDNKLIVMIQWFWHYFTRKGGARLITGEEGKLNGNGLVAKAQGDRTLVR